MLVFKLKVLVGSFLQGQRIDTRKTNQFLRRVHVIAKCERLLRYFWIYTSNELDVTSQIPL